MSDDPKELADQLSELPDELREATVNALKEIGTLAVELARVVHSPHVDTGTLDSSIRYEIEEVGPHITLRLLAGGKAYINPKTGRGCDYAGIIESKWPYLRPAYEHVKPLVDDVINKYVAQIV